VPGPQTCNRRPQAGTAHSRRHCAGTAGGKLLIRRAHGRRHRRRSIFRTPARFPTAGARCTAAWLCDAGGEPCYHFEQGQTASFFSEFQLLRDVQVPIGGLAIYNDAGLCVHGKTTLEYGTAVPRRVAAGTRLRFRHEVTLDLAVGDFYFTLGLSTLGAAEYEQRQKVAHCHLASMIASCAK